MAVATDVLNFEVKQLVILLKQWLISGAQEVICRVVDVEPYLLFGVLRSVELSCSLLVRLCCVEEVFLVVFDNCKVKSVV